MKKLFLGAMALLAAVTLVACGSKKDAYESIKENKKLVVAVSPDYAPFEFKTLVDGKDQVVGSDIKLAQAIADELGVKLEVTTMSFDNVLSSLQAGKADIAISEHPKPFQRSGYWSGKSVSLSHRVPQFESFLLSSRIHLM